MLVDVQILLAVNLMMLLYLWSLAHHIRPLMCIKMGYYHQIPLQVVLHWWIEFVIIILFIR